MIVKAQISNWVSNSILRSGLWCILRNGALNFNLLVCFMFHYSLFLATQKWFSCSKEYSLYMKRNIMNLDLTDIERTNVWLTTNYYNLLLLSLFRLNWHFRGGCRNFEKRRGGEERGGEGGRWGLVTKEDPPWLGATCQKVLKIRPPRLAKNALASVTLNYLSLQRFVNILMK